MLSDLKTFRAALTELEVERGIAKDKIIETIELALAAAYKKDYGKRGQIIRAEFDLEKGDAKFSQIKIVVDETMLKPEEENELPAETPEPPFKTARPDEEISVEEELQHKVRFNPERHIMIDEARKIKKDVKPGDELVFALETKDDYGRIAAQTAKQVIIQRIREAERESVFDEYKSKQGEIVSGIVQRIEGRVVFLDLGRTTAILPAEEQMRSEHYRIGERIKALLFLVEKSQRGTSLLLSRTHPQFLAKLFELEVPEIAHGSVVIKNVAREAGGRSKIAVASTAPGIDPVGSCVGQKGVRVNTVIGELGNEKIDIIEWSDDISSFIAHSLSPAKIVDVETNDRSKTALVTVDESQLSLAIGRGGQNVRLAAKLTGWKIDIRSRSGESLAKASEEGDVEGEAIKDEKV